MQGAGGKNMKNETSKNLIRCGWCGDDPLYVAYHDEEWGYPVHDDHKLFEFLLLEGAQAGLSWITVLRKRERYRSAFDDFDPVRIATYGERKVNQLLRNEGIIRNRLKIESAISNARQFLEIVDREGSFDQYVWQFVDRVPKQNDVRDSAEIAARSERSEFMSKTLRKDGFRFVGPTICYAYMQATGMVNDHLVSCHRHPVCRDAG
jgi:DNA-3-methyladenine glycosylase I